MAIVPDMIGIVVRDMATSLRFYRLLGLDVPEGAEHEGHVEVTTSNGYRIAWDTEETIRSFDPAWTRPVGNSVTVAFRCDDAAGVDQAYQQIVASGFTGHKAPWDAVWGQRYAQVADPDGTVIDLFAPLG